MHRLRVHYVHHPSLAANSMTIRLRRTDQRAILAAALKNRYRATHLPSACLYTYGGREKAPLVGGPKRFGQFCRRVSLVTWKKIELAQ